MARVQDGKQNEVGLRTVGGLWGCRDDYSYYVHIKLATFMKMHKTLFSGSSPSAGLDLVHLGCEQVLEVSTRGVRLFGWWHMNAYESYDTSCGRNGAQIAPSFWYATETNEE